MILCGVVVYRDITAGIALSGVDIGAIIIAYFKQRI
jgi:hypothetical protein